MADRVLPIAFVTHTFVCGFSKRLTSTRSQRTAGPG